MDIGPNTVVPKQLREGVDSKTLDAFVHILEEVSGTRVQFGVSSIDVAKHILFWYESSASLFRLQMLCVWIQIRHLGYYGIPAFDDDIVVTRSGMFPSNLRERPEHFSQMPHLGSRVKRSALLVSAEYEEDNDKTLRVLIESEPLWLDFNSPSLLEADEERVVPFDRLAEHATAQADAEKTTPEAREGESISDYLTRCSEHKRRTS
jgi:hypothetical protein